MPINYDTEYPKLLRKYQELESTLSEIAKLPDEWRGVVEKLRSPRDVTAVRACAYLSSAANQLKALIKGDSK